MARRILIAGNWKMNGTAEHLSEVQFLNDALNSEPVNVEILVCPPATLLKSMREGLHRDVHVGGQNCHFEGKGAFTGEISANMLKDAGAAYVILGHSERRMAYAETNDLIRRKQRSAHASGLTAVVCIGESRQERDAGETLEVLGRQLAGSLDDGSTAHNTVVAYEPIWAIGTGLIPSIDDVREVHAFLRDQLVDRFGSNIGHGIRLLYGGSVQPANAAELLTISNVDGALVGGASLKGRDFLAICEAGARSIG